MTKDFSKLNKNSSSRVSDKIVNIIKMLGFFESGMSYTVKELSEKLNVSKKTIYRYLQTLQSAYLPIDRDPVSLRYSVGGGFTFKKVGALIEKKEYDDLHVMADSVNSAVFIVDENGRIIYWNSAAEKLYGYKKEELTGKAFYKYLSPKRYHKQHQKSLAEFKKAGKLTMASMPNKFISQDKSGREFPVEVSLSTMTLGGNNSMILNVRDITSQKRTEEALKNIALGFVGSKGDDLLRSLVKKLANFVPADNAHICELMPGEEKTFRVVATTPGALGKGNYICRKPCCICNLVQKEGFKYFSGNVQEKAANPNYFIENGFISYSGVPLLDSDSKKIGVISIMSRQEFSNQLSVETMLKIFAVRASMELERRRAEDNIEMIKNEIELLTSSTQDAIYMLDNNGDIIYWNKAAERIYGFSSSAIIGKRAYKYLSPERFHEKFSKMREVMKRTGTHDYVDTIGEHIAVRKNGEEFITEASISRVKVKGALNLLIVARDKSNENKKSARLIESDTPASLVATSNATIVLDKNGNIAYWNMANQKVFNFKREEVLGNHFCTTLIADKFQKNCDLLLNEIKESKNNKFKTKKIKLSIKRKDGITFPVDVTFTLIKREDEPLMIVASFPIPMSVRR